MSMACRRASSSTVDEDESLALPVVAGRRVDAALPATDGDLRLLLVGACLAAVVGVGDGAKAGLGAAATVLVTIGLAGREPVTTGLGITARAGVAVAALADDAALDSTTRSLGGTGGAMAGVDEVGLLGALLPEESSPAEVDSSASL
ncbi:hypothetical protein AMAG_09905 [Allomyces macrogynus ATCC 38327]|uniref:Uncharacterized protein n=1 Tax=Allomyces macrogynus (strain ATCC 38327) TaxID=578462 RepID=A0A0L0SQ97_ALLM3|nr:hypothetical protein AMAG_09905 [Allomyces macrogynus ATCC 38327]|eukprot:KNE64544.1 hypothetical protein AMAG_09905 [Allomyces macrogynus ATCC 38327]